MKDDVIGVNRVHAPVNPRQRAVSGDFSTCPERCEDFLHGFQDLSKVLTLLKVQGSACLRFTENVALGRVLFQNQTKRKNMFTTITYNLHPNAEHQQILKGLMYNSARFYNLCLRKRKSLYTRQHSTARLSDKGILPKKQGFQNCMNSLPQWLSSSLINKADKKADAWLDGTSKSLNEMKPYKTTRLDISDCPKSLTRSFLILDDIGTIIVDGHDPLPANYRINRWMICIDPNRGWVLRLLVYGTARIK